MAKNLKTVANDRPADFDWSAYPLLDDLLSRRAEIQTLADISLSNEIDAFLSEGMAELTPAQFFRDDTSRLATFMLALNVWIAAKKMAASILVSSLDSIVAFVKAPAADLLDMEVHGKRLGDMSIEEVKEIAAIHERIALAADK